MRAPHNNYAPFPLLSDLCPLWEIKKRGHTYMTYKTFWIFCPPPHCTHLVLICTIYFMQPPLFHLLFGDPPPPSKVGRHISKVPNETRVSCSTAISISFLFRFYYFPLFSLKLSSGFPQLFPLFSLRIPPGLASFDTCDIFMG